MGIMKRIEEWRRYYPPLPQPLRAFAGLEPRRDPEAFRERKAAEREAREERKAIQEEGRGTPPRTHKPAGTCVPEPEPDQPRLAAAGWYRVGSAFYRIGSGPHPLFWSTHERRIAQESRPTRPADRPPARLQLSLFDQ